MLIAAGLVLFTQAPVDGSYFTDVLPVMLLIGTGAGAVLPVADDAGDVRRDAEDAGLASGLVNTTVQVGGALGLAVLATLVGDRRPRACCAAGESAAAALNGGYHLAYAVAAGLVLVAIAIARGRAGAGATGAARGAAHVGAAGASPRTRRRHDGRWPSSGFAVRSARSPAGARSTGRRARPSASFCVRWSGPSRPWRVGSSTSEG